MKFLRQKYNTDTIGADLEFLEPEPTKKGLAQQHWKLPAFAGRLLTWIPKLVFLGPAPPSGKQYSGLAVKKLT